MKCIIRSIVLAGTLTLLLFGETQAQGEPRKFGFGVTVDPGIILTGRYWIASDVAFDARFGLSTIGQDVFVVGGRLLKTFSSANKVYPYFGGGVHIINADRPFEDDTTVTLGAILGGEYFVVDRFSVVGESQLEIDFNGGTTVATQVALSVLFYLN